MKCIKKFEELYFNGKKIIIEIIIEIIRGIVVFRKLKLPQMYLMERPVRYKPRREVIDERFLSSVEPKPKNSQNIRFGVKQNEIYIHLSTKN